jgi:hypothetical protein
MVSRLLVTPTLSLSLSHTHTHTHCLSSTLFLPPCPALLLSGSPQPELPALHRTLLSVLEHSGRQGSLVRQLLAATEQSQAAAARLQAQCRALEAELARQRQSAERAAREAEMVAGVEVGTIQGGAFSHSGIKDEVG